MVRPGYKQTEVGEIPEDWEVQKLMELIHSVEYGSSAKSKIKGKIPVIRMGNLQNGKIDWNDLVYTDDEEEIRKYSLHIGDVLFNRTNTTDLVGKTSIYKGEQAAIFAGYLIRINRKEQLIDAEYLNYILNAEFSRKYGYTVLSVAVGQANINGEKLKSYPIPIPPTNDEQKAIAKALSDVDELIVSLEKLIAKKRDIKTATMQQLLTGKKRLPGFGEGKGYKKTELGEIPEDWDVKKINEFTDCTAGGTPSTLISEYWDGHIPWMSSGELHLKRVNDVTVRITDLGLKNSSARMLPKSCVLIGLAGQGKTRGTVAVNEIELCTNQSIAAIFPSFKHSTDYLFYNLHVRYDELRGLSTGDGGRGGLNLTIIRNIEIPFPEKEEQKAIAEVIHHIDMDITVLTNRLTKTKSIKQGMMQELLTGRTRLVAPQTAEYVEEERLHGT